MAHKWALVTSQNYIKFCHKTMLTVPIPRPKLKIKLASNITGETLVKYKNRVAEIRWKIMTITCKKK